MQYLRNTWYVAGWAHEIAPGKIVARTILDEPLALFRRQDGTLAAILDQCPHRFAPLSAGFVRDDALVCRYHGLAFDGTGACVLNPHGPLLKSATIPSYPMHEAHRAAWIWMGDPARADPALIPDLSYLADAPDTAFSAGELLSGPGNYQVFVDNILDLSHTDYLHPDTLGGGNITKAKQEITETDGYFDVNWHTEDTQPSPLTKKLNPHLPDVVDTFTRVRWFAPSVMKLTNATVGAGLDESGAVASINAHIFTPESARSTHYFFAATRNFRTGDTELNERIATARQHIFTTEDKPMIELVDRRMGDREFWSLRPLLFSIDKASIMARRRLQRLLKAELASAEYANAAQ